LYADQINLYYAQKTLFYGSFAVLTKMFFLQKKIL
jgi:hypothetical protein